MGVSNRRSRFVSERPRPRRIRRPVCDAWCSTSLSCDFGLDRSASVLRDHTAYCRWAVAGRNIFRRHQEDPAPADRLPFHSRIHIALPIFLRFQSHDGRLFPTSGYPIIACALVASIIGSDLLLGLSVFLGAVFYPPAFLVVGVFAALRLLQPFSIRRVGQVLIFGLPAVLLVGFHYLAPALPEIGPSFDWSAATKEPELTIGGFLL